jgi:FtsP/CotA-like multicopper oxidase with cupredoxin domain
VSNLPFVFSGREDYCEIMLDSAQLPVSLIRVAWVFLVLLPVMTQAATREYHLTIAKESVTITGRPVDKITVNGTIPGPVLKFTQGDDAVIHVTNTMNEDSSVHWHGLLLPGFMDGAPGFNGFAGIKPGETFTYRFPIRQTGTYWYHAHSLGQEQEGLYGGIVIAPKTPERIRAARDYVLVLSDFSEESADAILGNLKKSSEYYQYRRRTVGDFLTDATHDGLGKTIKTNSDWGKMRMLPTDLADVTGYHFLVNGKTNAQNWTGLFTPGEPVRLRFINAAAMTFYDLRIPGLKMTIIAADGQLVEPVDVDEFRFGTAETYDVVVTPKDDKAYTIIAESLDREGFALATLAPRQGMRGETPSHRPRTQLTMGDMNMAEMMKDDPDMDMSTMDLESGWAKSGAPEGTKILRYEDLRFKGIQADTRAPTREVTVRLGGNMDRYIWTLDGKSFDPANAVYFAFGERVRLTYINETMMAHPIHLHGMFVQLENGQPDAKLPNKHTVIVPPGQTVSVLLTADEPGAWPFHCHLLYHMASGMMTTFIVGEKNANVYSIMAGDEATAHAMHSGHDDHGPGFIPHAFTLETDGGWNNRSATTATWDFDGWVGGDSNKLWLKSEGEVNDETTEQAELWGMWSRNIDTFWDVQLGLRQDFQPHSNRYLVAGLNGLAPYFIETEAHGFVKDDGGVSARLRAKYEALLTNRLVLRPQIEADLNASEDQEEKLGTGLTDAALELQLRYEIERSFAPYMALRYQQKFDTTADFAHEDAEPTTATSLNLGIRFLF